MARKRRGRGPDKRKRKRRRDRLSPSEKQARDRAVANVAANRGFDVASTLVGAGTIIGLGAGLSNKKFRQNVGSKFAKGSEAVGTAAGYLGTAFKRGTVQGGAMYGTDELKKGASKIPDAVKQGSKNFRENFGGDSREAANTVGRLINRKTKETANVPINLGRKARAKTDQAIKSKMESDIRRTKAFVNRVKSKAVDIDYNIRFKNKEKKVTGFFSSSFWAEFSARKNSNIEFAKTRKRKPHTEATKRKISESLKKNRSAAQNFKDASQGVSSLVNAGSKLSKTYDARRLINQDLTIRERRRQFTAIQPLLNTGFRGVIGQTGIHRNQSTRIFANATYKNATTREYLARLKKQMARKEGLI